MQWTQNSNYQFISSIEDDHATGIAQWLEKIIELAPSHDDEWNVLVADLRSNGSSSILDGYLMWSDYAVGNSTGFNVLVELCNGGILGDQGSDIALVKQWLVKATTSESINNKLCSIAKIRPLQIRLLDSGGYGRVTNGIPIHFNFIETTVEYLISNPMADGNDPNNIDLLEEQLGQIEDNFRNDLSSDHILPIAQAWKHDMPWEIKNNFIYLLRNDKYTSSNTVESIMKDGLDSPNFEMRAYSLIYLSNRKISFKAFDPDGHGMTEESVDKILTEWRNEF